jgi:Fe2+ or Zn2+ uptake regulation protein
MNRNTKQRQLVLELVQNSRTHPTADEVYEMARRSSPNISRGTVYRNLGVLVEMGMLRRLSLSEGPDRFDSVLQAHYHFDFLLLI